MSKMGKGLKISSIEKFDINRRVIAHSTHKAWNEAPHVSYLYEPDVTNFFKYYTNNRSDLSHTTAVSFNTVLLKVISEGLKAAPKLNSILKYNSKNKTGWQKLSSDINIALPWLLDDGRMITPVVKNLESKTLTDISDYIAEIARKINNTDIDAMQYQVCLEETISDILEFKIKVIRQIIAAKIGPNRLLKPTKKQKKAYNKIPACDKIIPSDLFDASTLVSNIGSIFKNQKGALSMLEIITPQIFVMGINAIQERATVIDDKKGGKVIAIRKILPLCMTFDHRAADFSDLIPFQNCLDEIFTHPKEIMKWI